MSRKHKKYEQEERLPPFVPLLKGTLDSPAWKALSHGARSLYVAIKRRWNRDHHNNGRLHVSQREAELELNSKRVQIARWFRELQHFGFVVQTSPGSLGVHGQGKAPHWRLTEMGTRDAEGYRPPTDNFRHWDGTAFTNHPKKQNPGYQKGSRVGPKRPPLVDPKRAPLTEPSGPEKGSIQADRGGSENGSILSIATPSALAARRSSAPLGVGRPSRYVEPASVSALRTVHAGGSKVISLQRFMLSTIEVSS